VTQYDDTNRGALFRNERKVGDKDPDHNGMLNVDGKEYWLNAWVKTSKNGRKFFSLSVKPKREEPSTKPTKELLDDEIPF
jgi:uncharacterized protein (DUF736 family)